MRNLISLMNADAMNADDDAETKRLQAHQRQEIVAAMARYNIKPTRLALKAGLSPSTINRFLKGDEKVTWAMSTRTLEKIKSALELLSTESDNSLPQMKKAPIQISKEYLERAAEPVFYTDDLPIVGQARGGEQGFFFDNGVVQGYASRPKNLLKVQRAYAVYMSGSSMEPRYYSGELLYVNPVKPPAVGDYVVIELRDGQGFVKRLLRRTQKAVVVQQLNPPKEIEFSPNDIKGIHLIVGSIRD